MIVVTSRECCDKFKEIHQPHDDIAVKMAALLVSETNPPE